MTVSQQTSAERDVVERPGRYLLAVECDGATYHSALWARERDRLRQDILEDLGWRFHRIWSTDWFYRRQAEVERLATALRSAQQAADEAADRAAIAAEPLLPAPGTAERTAIDQRHAAIIAGLLAGFAAHRKPTRQASGGG